MQRRLIVICVGVFVVGSAILSLSEARTPRSRLRSTTTTTTEVPETSKSSLFSSSSTTSKTMPSGSEILTNSTSKPRGRRVLRRRRPGRAGGAKKLRKRLGPVNFDDENTSSQQEQNLYNREALYERPEQRPYRNPEEFDDYDKSPYYSPIKRQRTKLKPIFKNQKPKQFNEHISALSPTPTAASHVNPYSTDPHEFDHNPDHDFPPPQPAPKNYAFAYAVRDDNNAEDFSHKEARDGKLTMGEYRINLPDGRVQVVRYTAGGTIGYKADVTYEGDDPRNKDLAKPTLPSGRPRPSGPTSRAPSFANYYPSSSPTSDPYSDDQPSFVPRSKKTRRPSNKNSQSYLDHSPSYISPSPTPSVYSSKPSPSSSGYHSASSYNGIGFTARPKSIYDKIPASSKKPKFQEGTLSYQHDQSPRAGPAKNGASSSRYQVEDAPKKSPFYPNNVGPTVSTNSGYHHDDISGPPGPPYYPPVSPTPSSSPFDSNQQRFSSNKRKPAKTPKKQIHYEVEDDYGPSTYTPIRSSKSGSLIPIEKFKAGPKKYKNDKPFKSIYLDTPGSSFSNSQGGYSQSDAFPPPPSKSNYQFHSQKNPAPSRRPSYGQQQQQQSYNSYDSPSVRYKEPFHYYNSQHPSYHHGGFTGSQPSPTPPVGMNQLHVNPTAAAYDIDYTGGGKQTYYFNRGSSGGRSSSPKPGRRVNRKQTTSSGLVYLETPGVGPRPTDLGVKELLSQLPNMPSNREHNLKTTIHAYEVGSKDYGVGVGYKNSESSPSRYNNNNDRDHNSNNHFDDDHHHHHFSPQLNTNQFAPHSHEESDSIGNYHRDYLYDGSPDSIVQSQPEISY